jgi:hypothetical protein
MRSEINQLKKQVEILNNYNEFYQRERNYINLYINKHIIQNENNTKYRFEILNHICSLINLCTYWLTFFLKFFIKGFCIFILFLICKEIYIQVFLFVKLLSYYPTLHPNWNCNYKTLYIPSINETNVCKFDIVKCENNIYYDIYSNKKFNNTSSLINYTLETNPHKYEKCTTFKNVYTTVNNLNSNSSMNIEGKLVIKNDTISYVFMTDCIKNDIYTKTIIKEYSLKNYNSMKAINDNSKICNQ